MLAVPESSDFAWIAMIVFVFAGAVVAARSVSAPTDAARLHKLEAKIDLILQHLGLEYRGPPTHASLSPEVIALADDPAKKIQAIALYRAETGLGLKAAKDAVEAYISNPG